MPPGGPDALVIDGGTDEVTGITVRLVPVAQSSDGTPFLGR